MSVLISEWTGRGIGRLMIEVGHLEAQTVMKSSFSQEFVWIPYFLRRRLLQPISRA